MYYNMYTKLFSQMKNTSEKFGFVNKKGVCLYEQQHRYWQILRF